MLDNFRKSLKNNVLDCKEIDLRKLRFALFKRSDNVTEQEHATLLNAFKLSRDLELFYQLKNQLVRIFDHCNTKKQAQIEVDQWINNAKNLANKYMDSFLKTFSNWYDKVLNFFNHRITNGLVEGKNNKIKLIKRRGFGYLNFKNFRLRVLTEC